MADRNKAQKGQESTAINTPNKNVGNEKDRKGDTGRTSNQGRKEASGGSANTNNQGRPKGNPE